MGGGGGEREINQMRDIYTYKQINKWMKERVNIWTNT